MLTFLELSRSNTEDIHLVCNCNAKSQESVRGAIRQGHAKGVQKVQPMWLLHQSHCSVLHET
jgi:hypothetical protein